MVLPIHNLLISMVVEFAGVVAFPGRLNGMYPDHQVQLN